MNRLSREEIEELYRTDGAPCVSAFMPTHRAGPEIRQDPIRLKNLLRTAADRLEEIGHTPDAAESLLEPGWEMVRDHEMWRHQEEGLAVFLCADGVRSLRSSKPFPELVVVADVFHVTPLLDLLPAGDERFHLLALSQERVRLFRGDREGLEEFEARELPEGLRDVVGYDFEQRSLQFHTGTGARGGGGGDRRAMFHGHGGAGDDAEEERDQFLHRVDEVIVRLIEPPRPPLVLAAVDRIAAAYRQLSKYDRLTGEVVEGNPDRLDARELHERAWPVAREVLDEPIREARRTFESQRHTERTGEALAEVIAAALAGRVDVLLVERGESRWGSFDEESGEATLGDSPGDGEDLVGRAAVETLLHGGAVHVLGPEEHPAEGPVAAVYRY